MITAGQSPGNGTLEEIAETSLERRGGKSIEKHGRKSQPSHQRSTGHKIEGCDLLHCGRPESGVRRPVSRTRPKRSQGSLPDPHFCRFVMQFKPRELFRIGRPVSRSEPKRPRGSFFDPRFCGFVMQCAVRKLSRFSSLATPFPIRVQASMGSFFRSPFLPTCNAI